MDFIENVLKLNVSWDRENEKKKKSLFLRTLAFAALAMTMYHTWRGLPRTLFERSSKSSQITSPCFGASETWTRKACHENPLVFIFCVGVRWWRGVVVLESAGGPPTESPPTHRRVGDLIRMESVP